MEQPTYQGFEQAAIPQVISTDGKGQINAFAGAYNQITGPVRSITNILACTIYLQSEGNLLLIVEPQRTILLYVLRGQVTVNDNTTASGHMLVEFSGTGTTIKLKAETETTILYCTGMPYHKPIVSQGPFVMNTQTEIMEAMRDYRMGKMGVLYEE